MNGRYVVQIGFCQQEADLALTTIVHSFVDSGKAVGELRMKSILCDLRFSQGCF
jgi:hypothetical protein